MHMLNTQSITLSVKITKLEILFTKSLIGFEIAGMNVEDLL